MARVKGEEQIATFAKERLTRDDAHHTVIAKTHTVIASAMEWSEAIFKNRSLRHPDTSGFLAMTHPPPSLR
jgi:hypothetical protein